MDDNSATGYDSRAALDFFKSAGKLEKIAQGTKIFAEKDKPNRLLLKPGKMYLLLQGEVGLFAGKKEIGAIRPGAVFGELAAITQAPRSAGAVAKSDCRVISLDEKQFQAALKKKTRVRPHADERLGHAPARDDRRARRRAAGRHGPEGRPRPSSRSTSRKPSPDFPRDPVAYYDRGRPIVLAGQSGLRMYVVTEGSVRVMINERTVERLGPGGVFGEAALLDESPRLATVVAERDCAVLPVTRKAFLALVKMSPGFAQSMLSSLARRLRYLRFPEPRPQRLNWNL